MSGNNQSENPLAGTIKSPKVPTENLEEIKSTLREAIVSDLTNILAEKQKEMFKLKALVVKKQATLTAPEESVSESENVPSAVTSTPVKAKTTATTLKNTPVKSRNNNFFTCSFRFHSNCIQTLTALDKHKSVPNYKARNRIFTRVSKY